MDSALASLFKAIDQSLSRPADPPDFWPTAETQQCLEQLCEVYLSIDADGRIVIREFIAQRAIGSDVWLMWTCASRMAERVAGPEALLALRRALAAVSIDNGSADYRDTLGILLKLYNWAEQAGLDPRPSFEAAAGISADSRTPGGCDSVADLIRKVGSREVS